MEAWVEGQVQGVFFRDHTRRQARSLGLVGWVRNEPDGRVRVVAEGPRSALERLLEAMRRGPPSAQVSRVDHRWEAATGELQDFRIRFS